MTFGEQPWSPLLCLPLDTSPLSVCEVDFLGLIQRQSQGPCLCRRGMKLPEREIETLIRVSDQNIITVILKLESSSKSEGGNGRPRQSIPSEEVAGEGTVNISRDTRSIST